MFMFGATGSGKTHSMEGNKMDPGVIQLLSDNIFNILEDKRYRTNAQGGAGGSQLYSFSIRIRYVEIVDEEIHDLL